MRHIYAFSDTQVFGEYPRFLLKYYENNNIHITTEPGEAEVMKAHPVDFVSFSYYMSSCVADDEANMESIRG